MPEPESTPVPSSDFSELLGPELASALAKKGFTALTPVQQSVLDPTLVGRDLRISSQTGSGKTLAIGFALRSSLSTEARKPSPVARPQALVIVPTRELAKQVHDELAWLYAPMKLRIAAVTGGAVYRDEHRALSAGPAIVVGTPGRLLDHLNRGGIEAGDVAAVVLDEADRMLDLGFRDELEAILAKAPPGHRTHLVSATFARDVAALADRVQQNPRRIEGTPLGSANQDIDHIVYLVNPRERVDALINVLLHHADEQTLVFARTRADVSEIARELQQAGFASGSLSGEMDQDARNRALSAFKRGDIRALIATDVAARGIDVQDIGRVIQVDPPTDPDTYTHRSGRTGRAGRKGVSAVLVAPAGLRRAAALLQRARVNYRIEPVPTAEAIAATQDEHWLAELTRDTEREVPERVQKQVERIVESGLSERALAQLIINVRRATGEPRHVTPLFPEPQRGGRFNDRAPQRPERGQRPQEREPRQQDREPRSFDGPGRSFDGPGRSFDGPPRQHERAASLSERPASNGEQWVSFHVSWGETHGADARRLVAMLCRRGNIRGSDIGAIRVNRSASSVEVSARVAEAFAVATREPDPRDPRVTVTAMSEGGVAPRDDAPPAQRPRAHVPPSEHRPPRASAPIQRERAARPSPPSAFRSERGSATAPPAPHRSERGSATASPAPHRAERGSATASPAPHRAERGSASASHKPTRGFTPAAASRATPAARSQPTAAPDVPPKRPNRKIVVTAQPTRRGPKKK
jgi:ATP-dependent RNA helicase DeaD